MTEPIQGAAYARYSRQGQPSHDTRSPICAGAMKMCAKESELFTSDLMESGDAKVSHAALDRFSGGLGVCTTVIKAPLGIANLIRLTAVTLASGDWEDLSYRKKKMKKPCISLQGLEMSVNWQNESTLETGRWTIITARWPELVEPQGGNIIWLCSGGSIYDQVSWLSQTEYGSRFKKQTLHKNKQSVRKILWYGALSILSAKWRAVCKEKKDFPFLSQITSSCSLAEVLSQLLA